jgi:hypothetical protein
MIFSRWVRFSYNVSMNTLIANSLLPDMASAIWQICQIPVMRRTVKPLNGDCHSDAFQKVLSLKFHHHFVRTNSVYCSQQGQQGRPAVQHIHIHICICKYVHIHIHMCPVTPTRRDTTRLSIGSHRVASSRWSPALTMQQSLQYKNKWHCFRTRVNLYHVRKNGIVDFRLLSQQNQIENNDFRDLTIC